MNVGRLNDARRRAHKQAKREGPVEPTTLWQKLAFIILLALAIAWCKHMGL